MPGGKESGKLFRNRFLEFKASQQQQALPLIYSSERLNSESLREQAPGPPTSCAGYYGRPGHVGEFGGYTTADPQSRARFTAAFRHALDGQKLGGRCGTGVRPSVTGTRKTTSPCPVCTRHCSKSQPGELPGFSRKDAGRIESGRRPEGYPILNHTVFKYAGSARLMGKSGGCGT